jgi:hypothetical protein
MADFEPVGARGAGNELPHPARRLLRGGTGVESAFHHGEVDEIGRQILFLQPTLDDGAVAAHPSQPG